MLKRIIPRCDRLYTFFDSNGEFTIKPMSVNKQGQIVFYNINTNLPVYYSLSEFVELYENCLKWEIETVPNFISKKEFRQSEKFYAVARGRLDFYMTNVQNFYKPLIANFDDACYGEFDNFGDALDFLREADERLPESARYVESSLTDNEMQIIRYYRSLSKAEKKEFRKNIYFEK